LWLAAHSWLGCDDRRYLPRRANAEGDEEQGAHTAGTAQLGL